jgi:hypothetical protein
MSRCIIAFIALLMWAGVALAAVPSVPSIPDVSTIPYLPPSIPVPAIGTVTLSAPAQAITEIPLLLKHTYPVAAVCTLTFDGVLVANQTLAAETDLVQVIMAGVGVHVVSARCSEGTWAAQASAVVNVTAASGTANNPVENTTLPVSTGSNASTNGSSQGGSAGGSARGAAGGSSGSNVSTVLGNTSGSTTATPATLLISPRSAPVGASVRLSGNVQENPVLMRILAKEPVAMFIVQTEDGAYEYEYEIAPGMSGPYTVELARMDGTPLASAELNVTADRARASLEIAGDKTAIWEGSTLVVFGSGFAPNSMLSGTLSGPISRSVTAVSNKAGDALLEFDDLRTGLYSLALSDSSLESATLTFTVRSTFTPAPMPPVDAGAPSMNEVAPENLWGPPSGPLAGNGQQQTVPDLPVPAFPSDAGTVQPAITDSPNEIEREDTGLAVWIMLIATFIVLGALAAGGYLVYTGRIDLHSASALMQSTQRLFGSHASAHLSSQHAQQLAEFIAQERAKGFDDLAIRNALLAKGWDKGDVDAVFTRLYK